MRRRRAELICGIIGGTLGLVGLFAAFFAPLGTEGGTNCTDAGCTSYTRAVSYAGSQGVASVIPYLIIFGLPMVGVAAGAVLHASRGSSFARGVLVFCTLLLGVFTVLGALSVGIFLLPVTALAVAATVLSGWRSRPDTAQGATTPAQAGVSTLRSFEVACGVAAAVIGGLALYLMVFDLPTCPATSVGGVISSSTYTVSRAVVSSPCATAYARLGAAGVLPLLIAAVVPLLAVALGAVAHGMRGSRAGQVVLWLGTLALLGFGVLLTTTDTLPAWVSQLPFAIVYLVPVAALALAASALAAVPGPRPRPGPATT
jgi:hypothetical protein